MEILCKFRQAGDILFRTKLLELVLQNYTERANENGISINKTKASPSKFDTPRSEAVFSRSRRAGWDEIVKSMSLMRGTGYMIRW